MKVEVVIVEVLVVVAVVVVGVSGGAVGAVPGALEEPVLPGWPLRPEGHASETQKNPAKMIRYLINFILIFVRGIKFQTTDVATGETDSILYIGFKQNSYTGW